ncbi:MAG TPA: DNA-directed RNA polymerase subunit alpha [Candidatus Angelobacter sp.]|jgi:DNA-directed RNA polymerase subunit alpha|nr:DNA-directed RNA polymerase subunit alpha [Candidatus Angelobacter sp.]
MDLQNFIKPDKPLVLNSNQESGLFQIKPLAPGFGCTIGNSLRRVLLSSLDGFAVTSIFIEGVGHEFSTIKGVLEDVTEIVLNFKKIRFKKSGNEKNIETVYANLIDNECVTAGYLEKFMTSFKVMNPDLIICHKYKSEPLSIIFTIEIGIGYVPAENNKKKESSLGTIFMDSIHTPIKNVKYSIEEKYCLLKKKNLETLLLEIKTDGSISPEKALKKASNILMQHFSIVSDDIRKTSEEAKKEDTEKIWRLLKTNISDVENLGKRTLNCFKSAGIKTFSDLVSYNVETILKLKNFGRKSLEELESEMKKRGLYFGMDPSKDLLNIDEN